MKLIGDLKKKVENATTKEEARESIKKAGMLLDDDELERVSGGATNPFNIPLDDPRSLAMLKMELARTNKESALSGIKDIEAEQARKKRI